MTQSHPAREADTQPTTDNRPVTRRSSAFARPAGNVFIVPDDGGSPLDDVSERPALIAPIEVTAPPES